MDIMKDMDLFVRIVHCNGLAAAGKELGLNASSVSMRIKNLEKHFQVKLLTRTTRSISLTDSGKEFYQDSLDMLRKMEQIEGKLKFSRDEISGPLRITVTSDLGRQHIAPLLDKFASDFPKVTPFLHLNDSVTDLVENNLDLAVRYGIPPDSQLIAQKIADSRRVLCAAPSYLERHGVPESYHDLSNHRCLTMVNTKQTMCNWFFSTSEGEQSINVPSSRSCDDGAQIRQWAVDGAGITLKSFWDVADDLKAKRLVKILDGFNPDYQSKSLNIGSNLFIVYQDRHYVPNRTRAFMSVLKEYFAEYSRAMTDEYAFN